MSWAEVKKINGDLTTPLDEKMDNLAGGVAGSIDSMSETMAQSIESESEAIGGSIEGLEDSIVGVGEAIRSIDSIKPSLRVTALDAGTITVTDGIHTYTKEMAQPGVAGFILQSLGDFDVTLESEGQTFTQTITVTELTVYRVTVGFPKLAVTAEEAGAITVSNGTDTYTETLEEAGTANFRLGSFGTYTVLLEEGQREGKTTVSVTEFTDYEVDVEYFSASLTVKCLITAGVGTVTATSTDGEKIYTADCGVGDTTLTITAARTYDIKVTQGGVDGEIAQQKAITTQDGTYTATAGFIAAIPDDYAGIEWTKVEASSGHISVSTGLSTNYKNIIEINGRGLLLGAYKHVWLNYVTQNGTVQFEILVDGVLWDQFTVPRNDYGHMAGWGNPINNKITVPREYTSTSSRARSTSGNQNINTGVMTNIGKCVQFNHSLVVRARYQNTPDSSDSIYNFEVAVYHY